MKKLNKRGFTLMEMLAVVAVIAVLVSIIIPVMTPASDKAAAAADAANLRAAKAAIATGILNGTYKEGDTITAEDLDVPAVSNYKKEAFKAEIKNNEILVSYGEMSIAYLADIADNGKPDNSNAASQTAPTETVPG